MVDGPADIKDLDKTEENKNTVRQFIDDVLMGGKAEKLTDYISTTQYDQHNPQVEDGVEGLRTYLKEAMSSGSAFEYVKVHHLIGQGNFVVAYSHTRMAGDDYAFFDIFRLSDDKIVEHWDAQEKIGPKETWKNSGKF